MAQSGDCVGMELDLCLDGVVAVESATSFLLILLYLLTSLLDALLGITAVAAHLLSSTASEAVEREGGEQRTNDGKNEEATHRLKGCY